eukprot:CAMPEP_0119029662 /NCGR_PEP_ID=MMETSP1176-20130426/40634_1 /TAXON_ID=265551 /ORGANISM="Synedropsis recta cf, Strain CCMP1620" /LENGTH=1229 /DNA_ID=CAMNT_0006986013 /DNA_START=177 /DNA_END=3866 /DNA_ORIENTATION=+
MMKCIVGSFFFAASSALAQSTESANSRNVQVATDGVTIATSSGIRPSLLFLQEYPDSSVISIGFPHGISTMDDISISDEGYLFGLSVYTTPLLCAFEIVTANLQPINCVSNATAFPLKKYTGLSCKAGKCVISGGTGGYTVVEYDRKTGQLSNNLKCLSCQVDTMGNSDLTNLNYVEVVMLDYHYAALSTIANGTNAYSIIVNLDTNKIRALHAIPNAASANLAVPPTNYPCVSDFYRATSTGEDFMVTACGSLTIQSVLNGNSTVVLALPGVPDFVAVTVAVDNTRNIFAVGGHSMEASYLAVYNIDPANPRITSLEQAGSIEGTIVSLDINRGQLAYVILESDGIQHNLISPAPSTPSFSPTISSEEPSRISFDPSSPSVSPTFPSEEPSRTSSKLSNPSTIPSGEPSRTSFEPSNPSLSPSISSEDPPSIASSKPNAPLLSPSIIPSEEPFLTSSSKPSNPSLSPNRVSEGPSIASPKPSNPSLSPTISSVEPSRTSFKPSVPSLSPSRVSTPPPVEPPITAGLNSDQIREKVAGFHQSAMYDGQVLKNPWFSGTYQMTAREQTVARYSGVSPTPSDSEIKNYYALACIFVATNGKSNPRVLTPDFGIPKWKESIGWATNDDYCTWYGIKCDQGLVSEIMLYDNTLYGTWPVEVAFLGETLTFLDVFGNSFNYCDNYQWFKSMEVLTFLFFGGTSWESNGIPSTLKFLTQLWELDISNTLWGGSFNPDAFTGSPDLYYLDMSHNVYSLGDSTSIPEALSSKNLIRFYMSNITITDSKELNLDFVGKMPFIVEFWADFTKFEGGIPANIGNARSLKSLSLAYCGLTGEIPITLTNTQITRLWIYANELTGTFPSILASQSWTHLFFEENNITGDMPTGICDQVGDTLQGLGADCSICKGTDGNDALGGDCCTCCGGDGCGNLEEITPAPTPAPSSGVSSEFSGFCFSGGSEVNVENSGPVKMADLAIGDAVKVADNKFERVYSFGHKNADASSEFLQIATEGNRKALELSKNHMVVIEGGRNVQIATEGNRKALELSKNHMVVIEGGRNVPASSIKIGDKLVSSSGELVAVKTVRTVIRQGAYAPFTASGSIIVNDVVASNYIAFQGSEYLKVSGVDTPFSYQWLAHMFKSVHRFAYMLGVTGETYTEGGISHWVDVPNKAGTWLIEQNFVIVFGLLLPSITFFGFVATIEAILNSQLVAATVIVGAMSVMAARRSVYFKMSAISKE